MSQFGWGFVVSQLMSEDPDWVPAYRWDKEASPYYRLRSDRVLLGLAYLTNPAVRLHFDLSRNESRLMGANAKAGMGANAKAGMGDRPSPAVTPSAAGSSSNRAKPSKSGHEGGPRRPRRRGCPEDHYYSYKLKKCVKSKFRKTPRRR